MNPPKKRVTFDFETLSERDLRKEGAYKYSLHPSTRATCMAFKVHGQPRIYLLPYHVINTHWKDLPGSFKIFWTNLINSGYEFSAHNAFFERCIYQNILVKRYGWPEIPLDKYRCTLAKCSACAMPRGLDEACIAMSLRVQKDRRGYSAMMATCKPTKAWKAWKKAQEKYGSQVNLTARQLKIVAQTEPPKFLTPESAPEIYKTLYDYCKIDVAAEEGLDDALPDLKPSELEIWQLNQTLNWRGLRLDTKTIEKAATIMSEENDKLLQELDALTLGLVTKPGAVKSILEFLEIEGVKLPNLRAKTIDDVLETRFDIDSDARRLLEIRKALSKASTKKYQSFLNRLNPDGRVRDILMYHGASTGRDTGTGIQPHNFPRGLLEIDKDFPYEPIENILELDKEELQVLYGESLSILFSHVLRNIIIPSEGCELFVADFSKIEVAVLWWLADNLPGLKILRSGLDPYKYQAAANTGKKYEEIKDEGDERQLGKAQTLGAGFGMAWFKFQTTAWDQYRLKLTDEQSKAAIIAYRETNAAVPVLWREYEKAAITAVKRGENHEQKGYFAAGKCRFYMKDKFLWVRLPSGRKLAYYKPQISWRVREYERTIKTKLKNGKIKIEVVKEQTRPMETLEFYAVNSKTKKWDLERTWGGTLTENIVQAIARDLMMRASINLEKARYKFLLSVHDEGLTERPIGEGNVKEFTKIMIDKPKWAEGLPLEAKGWVGPRYRK